MHVSLEWRVPVGKSDDCGMGRDEPIDGILSSGASADDAGDSGCSNINIETRRG